MKIPNPFTVPDVSAAGDAPVGDAPIVTAEAVDDGSQTVVVASPAVGEIVDAPKGKIRLKATKFDVHNSQSKTIYRQNEVVEVDAIGNFEKAQIAAGYLVQL